MGFTCSGWYSGMWSAVIQARSRYTTKITNSVNCIEDKQVDNEMRAYLKCDNLWHMRIWIFRDNSGKYEKKSGINVV